ncbi:MAG: hypothetical protein V1836_00605 [Candidatus Aenigmatarchaeota archaeon]
MRPPDGYVFAARYEKPAFVSRDAYLSDLKRTLEAVYDVINQTNIEEKYIQRKRGMNADLVRGSTVNGRYVFARVNAEIRIVSEDPYLTPKVMAKYKGKFVIPPKRVTSKVVRLDTTVHQMMHELFGKDLSVSATYGEQAKLPL